MTPTHPPPVPRSAERRRASAPPDPGPPGRRPPARPGPATAHSGPHRCCRPPGRCRRSPASPGRRPSRWRGRPPWRPTAAAPSGAGSTRGAGRRRPRGGRTARRGRRAPVPGHRPRPPTDRRTTSPAARPRPVRPRRRVPQVRAPLSPGVPAGDGARCRCPPGRPAAGPGRRSAWRRCPRRWRRHRRLGSTPAPAGGRRCGRPGARACRARPMGQRPAALSAEAWRCRKPTTTPRLRVLARLACPLWRALPAPGPLPTGSPCVSGEPRTVGLHRPKAGRVPVTRLPRCLPGHPPPSPMVVAVRDPRGRFAERWLTLATGLRCCRSREPGRGRSPG